MLCLYKNHNQKGPSQELFTFLKSPVFPEYVRVCPLFFPPHVLDAREVGRISLGSVHSASETWKTKKIQVKIPDIMVETESRHENLNMLFPISIDNHAFTGNR